MFSASLAPDRDIPIDGTNYKGGAGQDIRDASPIVPLVWYSCERTFPYD